MGRQTLRPAQTPLTAASAPGPAGPRLAGRLTAPQCNSLQPSLEGGKESSAGPCGSTWRWSRGRVSGPSGWVWEGQREGRFAKLCRREPSPFYFQPLAPRKKQGTIKCGGGGARRDGGNGAFEGCASAERCLSFFNFFFFFFGGGEVLGKKAGKRIERDPARQPGWWLEVEWDVVPANRLGDGT